MTPDVQRVIEVIQKEHIRLLWEATQRETEGHAEQAEMRVFAARELARLEGEIRRALGVPDAPAMDV